MGQPLDWGHYVAWLVEQHGTLAAAAGALCAQRGYADEVTSVERALRRLRGRGGKDGGVWGQRALRAFGVPSDVESRIRWMGQYHTRFSDLPRSLCLELLRPWDRPPVSESAAHVWVLLGRASVALRGRERTTAAEHLARAERIARGIARLEWILVHSFLISREQTERAEQLAHEALGMLQMLPLSPDDLACYRARCVDSLGWFDNIIRKDHEAARERYAALPEAGPAFARVRRHNGLGWSLLKLGDRDAAKAHAHRAIEAAGDGGSLRLRVMALGLLAATLPSAEADAVRDRADAIVRRLEDEELRVRLARHRGT